MFDAVAVVASPLVDDRREVAFPSFGDSTVVGNSVASNSVDVVVVLAIRKHRSFLSAQGSGDSTVVGNSVATMGPLADRQQGRDLQSMLSATVDDADNQMSNRSIQYRPVDGANLLHLSSNTSRR
jgi:hypothetical protein